MSKLTPSQPQVVTSEALYAGWQIFKHKWAFVLGISVVMFVLQFLPGFITGLLGQPDSATAAIIRFAGMILNLIVSMGWTYILIRLVREEDAKFEDLFAKASLILKFLAAVILYSLIVIVGLVLFVIPGLVWSIKYVFVPYLVIDKGLGPIAALKASGEMTQGVKWDLVGLALTLMVVNLLGLLALFVGLVVTTPVTALAQTFVYNKLLSKAKSA